MPLVNTGPTNVSLTGSLADGASNFASMMARQGVNENQQAAAALNREKTLGEAAWNNAMAENRSTIRGNMHQPGTMIEGNMAVDRPLTQQQNWDNEDAMRRIALKEPEENPWTRDKYGRTYSQSTGRTMDGGQERIGEIEQMGDANIQADTFKSNAAGQKSLSDIADNEAGKWDGDYTTSIRGEWKKEPTYKAYQGMKMAQDRMEAMLKQSKLGESNVADQSMLTMYAKVLDPDSVVRGSEVDALVSSTGMRGMFQNLISKLDSGGRLDAKDRKAFMSASRALFKAAESQALETQAIYQQKATEGGRSGQVIWNPIEAQDFNKKQTAEERGEELVSGGMTFDEATVQLTKEGY